MNTKLKILKRRGLLIAIIGVVIVITIAIMLRIFSHRTTAKRNITIVTSPELVKSVLNVIKEKKLLNKYLPKDVTVKWINIDGTSNIRDALATGQADIGPLGTIGFINAIEKKYPLYLISNSDNVVLYLISSNPDIKTATDVASANKIAINSLGSSAQVALQIFAKEKFGNYHYFDNKIISPGQDVITDSMQTSKDMDVAIVNVNQYFSLKDKVNLLQILDNDGILLTNYVVSNVKFANNNQDIISAFYKAERESVDYLNNNPNDASMLLAPIYGLSCEQVLYELKNNKRQLEITDYDNITKTLHNLNLLENNPTPYSKIMKYDGR